MILNSQRPIHLPLGAIRIRILAIPICRFDFLRDNAGDMNIWDRLITENEIANIWTIHPVWWCVPTVLTFGRERQEVQKVKVSLGYI